MKVILLQDVNKVGKKGDLVEASDSYARNVLIRRKLAVEATGQAINDLKLKKANDEKIAEENLEKAKELKEQLGIELDRRKIVVENPIKTIGSMSVIVKLHPKVKAELTVKVEKL